MKDNYTHIVCVLDKSGSMGPLTTDTIGGFNKFLEEQKKVPGKATISVVLFDTSYVFLCKNVDIQDFKGLTDKNYVPSGCTALIDSQCRAIDETGEFLKGLSELDRPSKVVCLTITDGEENSSREFNLEQLKSKVEHQKNVYKWEFVFLGANIDSYQAGVLMGYSNTTNYVASSVGTYALYSGVSNKMSAFRSCQCDTMDFTQDEKAAIEKPE